VTSPGELGEFSYFIHATTSQPQTQAPTQTHLSPSAAASAAAAASSTLDPLEAIDSKAFAELS